MKLVKDLTEESARSEVKFHLDTNLEATNDNLLNHLRMAFQMSETFETSITQFYSKTQRSKETFDEYGDDFIVSEIIYKQTDTLTEELMDLR